MAEPVSSIPGRSIVWTAAKIMLALALVSVVAMQTSIADLQAAYARMSPIWLLPSLAMYVLAIVVVARRFWELIDRRARFRDVVTLTILQTVIGNLFANAAGAASFITLLRVRHQVSITRSIASVVLAKLADLFTMMLLLIIGSIAVWRQIVPLQPLVTLLMIILGTVVAVFGLVIIFRHRAIHFLRHTLQALHITKFNLVSRMLDLISELANQDPQQTRRLLLSMLVYSTVSTLFGLAFSYLNTRLLGLAIDLPALLFFTAITQLVAWIPIQVFGGLGTFEATGLYILNLFVSDQTQVVPFLLASRIYLYLLNALLLPYLLIEHWVVQPSRPAVTTRRE